MSALVFACVLGGAFLGMFFRNTLPTHHLSGATKDVVKLGTGLIGTIAALVLGLLIASANSTFQTESSQVQQLTANVIFLDQTLAQYGPETASVRNLMRRAVASMADRIWRENSSTSGQVAPFEASAAASTLYDEILKLAPHDERQRSLQARAIVHARSGKNTLAAVRRGGGSNPNSLSCSADFLACYHIRDFASSLTTTPRPCRLMHFAFSASVVTSAILELVGLSRA